MGKVYCKYCGNGFPSVQTLTSGSCIESPTKKHVLYEGTEKAKYSCKFCGQSNSSMHTLCAGHCNKSPTKHHQPA